MEAQEREFESNLEKDYQGITSSQRFFENIRDWSDLRLIPYLEKPYECLSRSDIVKKQDEAIKQVQAVTSLPAASSRIVLQSFRVCIFLPTLLDEHSIDFCFSGMYSKF